ncbi:MAG TPA: alternative ribosome rescue aminoacyl-tRNA hydrolase ArfB [Pirellulales bacterium]|nr:alternative ribosome rescue aminoacyl-tRNA hydrolase ArfB [Pirellulales bacterium]
MSTAETPPSRAPALTVTNSLRIPLDEFEFTYTRSSGPGGQNVNKVNSKALLRWPVRTSPSLPEPVRQRFLSRYSNRVTAEGDLLVSSQRYRDQAKNIDDCLSKLREMLAEVAAPPVRRKRTKPSRASIKRRLENKRRTSDKKRGRREID